MDRALQRGREEVGLALLPDFSICVVFDGIRPEMLLSALFRQNNL